MLTQLLTLTTTHKFPSLDPVKGHGEVGGGNVDLPTLQHADEPVELGHLAAMLHTPGNLGRKLLSCSQCQELGQRANLASDWLLENKGPIRSRVSSLTLFLT